MKGNGGSVLGVIENSLKTGKPPGGWEERPFQGTDPDYAPHIIITFVLTVTEEERGNQEGEVENRKGFGGYLKSSSTYATIWPFNYILPLI